MEPRERNAIDIIHASASCNTQIGSVHLGCALQTMRYPQVGAMLDTLSFCDYQCSVYVYMVTDEQAHEEIEWKAPESLLKKTDTYGQPPPPRSIPLWMHANWLHATGLQTDSTLCCRHQAFISIRYVATLVNPSCMLITTRSAAMQLFQLLLDDRVEVA